MCVVFVGRGEVCVTHHTAQNLWIHTGFCGLSDKCVPIVMGGKTLRSNLPHKLFELPLGKIGVGLAAANEIPVGTGPLGQ